MRLLLAIVLGALAFPAAAQTPPRPHITLNSDVGDKRRTSQHADNDALAAREAGHIGRDDPNLVAWTVLALADAADAIEGVDDVNNVPTSPVVGTGRVADHAVKRPCDGLNDEVALR